MFTLSRSRNNPILSPMREHPWEAAAAFNGCPIIEGKNMRMIYRAMSEPDLMKENHARTSVIAQALSENDGLDYVRRKVLISPSESYDRYGCEDPRVTKIDGTNYIFYTALGGYPFSADNIKVAVALSKDLETIDSKHLVTPFNAKAMALFPEKINGKLAALLTINTDRKPSDICYAEFDSPDQIWSESYWTEWQKNVDSKKIQIRRLSEDHIELGAPPVLTDKGWVVVYSHVQRYGHSDQVFGIEALLLDKDNPRHVIGRTPGPFMVSEDHYELTGQVSNVVFPSGALIRDGKLEVYYGAADTFCAMASIPIENLLASLTEGYGPDTVGFKRYPGNPIISPRPSMLWETRGTLNPAAIDLDEKVHILYRAVSVENVSTFGYAMSIDGLAINERSDKPFYFPRNDLESKGCEDPRIVKIGSMLYMTYTAYDGSTPRVAVSSISCDDFLSRKWGSWSKPEIITPMSVTNKDSAILPEPVNGKYLVFHRVNNSVCAAFVDSLDFSKERITECIEILSPRRGMWDGLKVGISTPPIKTEKGWLMLYHGVSWSAIYRVGALLLDLNDPTIVIARTAFPIFEPKEEYECRGVIPDVVFPCGLVARNGMAYMYYGAGDDVVGVATIKMDSLLKILEV